MTSGKLHLFRKLEMAGKDTGSLRDAFTFGSVWHLVSLTSMILTVVRVGRLSHAIKYDVDTVARPCGNVVPYRGAEGVDRSDIYFKELRSYLSRPSMLEIRLIMAGNGRNGGCLLLYLMTDVLSLCRVEEDQVCMIQQGKRRFPQCIIVGDFANHRVLSAS
jgi:hypothetical protein